MADDRRAGVFLAYRGVMESILSDAKETYAALGLLHQGVVATSLLNFTRLETAYTQVSLPQSRERSCAANRLVVLQFKLMARNKGMEVVFHRPDVLLGAHAAYWTEGSVLRFAIPVPLVAAGAKLLRAYRLEAEPTTVPGSDGMQILYTSPHKILLVSPER